MPPSVSDHTVALTAGEFAAFLACSPRYNLYIVAHIDRSKQASRESHPGNARESILVYH